MSPTSTRPVPTTQTRRPTPGTPHPARYSPEVLEVLSAEIGPVTGPVLDPFAGTGRIHQIGRDDTIGIEIEPEWANLHPRTFHGDATELPFLDAGRRV